MDVYHYRATRRIPPDNVDVIEDMVEAVNLREATRKAWRNAVKHLVLDASQWPDSGESPPCEIRIAFVRIMPTVTLIRPGGDFVMPCAQLAGDFGEWAFSSSGPTEPMPTAQAVKRYVVDDLLCSMSEPDYERLTNVCTSLFGATVQAFDGSFWPDDLESLVNRA